MKSGGAGVAQAFICVSGARIENALVLDSGRKPKCFLRVTLGQHAACTVLVESFTPDWSGGPLLELPLAGSGSHARELQIEVIYKSFLRGDEHVGVAHVSLDGLDFAPIDAEAFPFHMTHNASARVRAAIEKNALAGNAAPSLRITVRLQGQ
jgi:hypothetical protein